MMGPGPMSKRGTIFRSSKALEALAKGDKRGSEVRFIWHDDSKIVYKTKHALLLTLLLTLPPILTSPT